MKLLVFSDSHGQTRHMAEVLQRIGKDMDGLIHLGDGYGDVAPLCAASFPHLQIHQVYGNCDWFSPDTPFTLVDCAGKRLLLTHGHGYHVKQDLQRLHYLALEQQVDVCLFGHSHVPVWFQQENIWFMNPGSISLPKGTPFPTYGVLHITATGDIHGSVVEMAGEQYHILL